MKDDRHQNIRSSVVPKKSIEEPWASERVARFINSFGYKEITLKSDTEPAMIAFRNRVAEICNAEAALEDAVKGGLVENILMLSSEPSSAMWRVAHKKNFEMLPDFAVVGGTCGELRVQVSKRFEMVGRQSKGRMARSQHKSVCHSG